MQPVIFDSENPSSVHDILWSWSAGQITARKAMDMLSLSDQMELYEAAIYSDVPIPGKPSARDEEMAEAFLMAIACPTDSP